MNYLNMLENILAPPLPMLPCYPWDFENACIPISLVQVFPISLLNSPPKQSGQDYSSSALSSPMVKIYLQDLYLGKKSRSNMKIYWDGSASKAAQTSDEHQRKKYRIRTLSGSMSTDVGCCLLFQIKSSKEHTGRELLFPTVMIPSSDPTNLDGVPCIVRVFSAPHVQEFEENYDARNENIRDEIVRIHNGTHVQILPRITCDWISEDRQLCRIFKFNKGFVEHPNDLTCAHDFSLIHELSGLQSVHHNYNDDEILLGYEKETVRALTIRMKLLLERQILVGTTSDAARKWHEGISRRRRMSHAFETFVKGCSIIDKNRHEELYKDSLKNDPLTEALPCPGALTVHDPHHGSGKTTLLATIATTQLKCQTVHIINASVLFAKYGASGADAALESLLHSIVLSAAVNGLSSSTTNVGTVCIILDHLECFVPPSIAGAYNDGDPSIPTLNSMRKFPSTFLYLSMFYVWSNILNHGTKKEHILPNF